MSLQRFNSTCFSYYIFKLFRHTELNQIMEEKLPEPLSAKNKRSGSKIHYRTNRILKHVTSPRQQSDRYVHV